MEFFDIKTEKVEIISVGRLDVNSKDNKEVDVILAFRQVPTEIKECVEELAKEHFAVEMVYFSTTFNEIDF